MTSAPPPGLAGVEVIEAGGDRATRICARLLAGMGARVVRDPGTPAGADDPLGVTGEGYAGTLTRAPDVRLIDEVAVAQEIARGAVDLTSGTIVTSITALGRERAARGESACELALQARGGLMAVTGEVGGSPQAVRVPVSAMLGGLVAATATLAAVRHRRLGGPGQSVDVCLLEVIADQLRTQASLVFEGRRDGYRAGSRHPVCAPWNAYRASDGWVVICSASDAQWRSLARCIDPRLADDGRFATVDQRRGDVETLDTLIERWTSARRVEDIVAAVEAVDVPVGPVSTVARLHEAARACATDGIAPALRSPVRYTRHAHAPAKRLPVAAASLPLSGIRVIELSRYAAGPVAGTLLAALGAEVIKVEAPGGEDCRAWAPRFGDTSGYFANYNTGKRSVVLDLSRPSGRTALWQLIGSAQVLLSNLRPGVLDRMGFDPLALAARCPGLVQAEISGYGRHGPRAAALDTVIQAQSGLLSLVGTPGGAPCRVGLSIADQVAGHFAAQGVIAALECRDRDGCGGLVDVPMIDAAMWLTLYAWPEGDGPLEGVAMLRARDGWLSMQASANHVPIADVAELDRAAALEALATRGIEAYPVREPGEVFAEDPVLRDRASVALVQHPCGVWVPVLRVPLGLQGTPVSVPAQLAALGADNATLLARDLDPPAGDRGAVAVSGEVADPGAGSIRLDTDDGRLS